MCSKLETYKVDLRTSQGLGQDACKLVVGVNKFSTDFFGLQLFLNKMAINLCMLVLSWNTGLEAMWRAAWLSQYNFINWTSQNFNSWTSCLIHTKSLVTRAIALNYASALDRATTLCFLLFQETIFPAKDAQCPVVDCMSMGQPTQSASLYLQIRVFPLSLYNNPCPGVFLMYLRMRITVFQWSMWGSYINWLTTLITNDRSGIVFFFINQQVFI